jgi:hypothetical protein
MERLRSNDRAEWVDAAIDDLCIKVKCLLIAEMKTAMQLVINKGRGSLA